MSTASVLIRSDSPAPQTAAPHYSLLLSTDTDDIAVAQRLRHEVFSTEPGYTLPGCALPDGTLPGGVDTDADRFDEFCDHLLVRDDATGELVGCYRMLPPPGAIAAGGLYMATEFDVEGLDALRPALVEMGRAVVRADHRNGAVILLMWTGILAYLDRCGYDHVAGCVSVPLHDPTGDLAPGQQLRGVRDFVRRRHAAPSCHTVRPHRPVVLEGRGLDDIAPPPRVVTPPLLRGYLRLGAQVCGEPAHDPVFRVGDLPALLDKRQADLRYLRRLRSAGTAAALTGAQR
ncbi:GNAT family N-acetyltransferase [Mycolicibacterium vaccae]|uniref:GNAT family N-acetyltransferase n=1 Tax=Mycolicibacterium vaccae TaxID=1810 RepID=UPI003D06C9E9